MTGRIIVTPTKADQILSSPLFISSPMITGYNLPPKQFISIICKDRATGIPVLKEAYWGYTPHWLKVLDNAPWTARAEGLAEKAMFKESLSARCLIPVSGYYEWKRYTRQKRAFAIRRPENRSFLLAGIHTFYPTSEYTGYETFALLTVPSNPFIQMVSERMPVTICREDADLWLEGSEEEARKMMRACDSDYLDYYPVSDLVNNPANQSRSVSEPSNKRFRYENK